MTLPSDIRKVLVIQTASIGDVILATPLLEKIHFYYPGAAIDFLLKKGNETLFEGHPFVHQLLVWDKSTEKYKNLHTLLHQVRDNQYDLVINIQRFFTSGLLTIFSGAQKTIGFNKNPCSLFFSKRINHRIRSGEVHEIDRNQQLLPVEDVPKTFPIKLYPGRREDASMSQYKTRMYITVSPASLWFTKQFPVEKWISFMKKVDPELMVYFLGAKNDVGLIEKIIAASGHKNSLNLAGKLSFLESAVLMRDARMNYVNDSAPLHLASSVNAPTTAIFCSTVKAFGFGPKSEDSVIVETREQLDCRPCGLHGFQECPKKHFRCGYHIDEQELLKRLEA